MLAVAHAGSCVSPQNKMGHPARCHRLTQTTDVGSRVECQRNMNRLQNNVLLCIIREIYICGLKSVLINFYVKYFNRVVCAITYE